MLANLLCFGFRVLRERGGLDGWHCKASLPSDGVRCSSFNDDVTCGHPPTPLIPSLVCVGVHTRVYVYRYEHIKHCCDYPIPFSHGYITGISEYSYSFHILSLMYL